MVTKIPGFVSAKDKITPAGSWCCIVSTRLGGTTECTPYIRTNRFFAWVGCSAQAVALSTSNNPASATLRGCPQDARTCCPAVGCYR